MESLPLYYNMQNITIINATDNQDIKTQIVGQIYIKKHQLLNENNNH
jgi:hypothetical protein